MKLGKFELDKIYLGDCKNLLKQLPDEKIDMCITSPPYWGLRDYGIGKDQLGLEPDFNLYIKNLCDIFDEVKRVLKKEGTCWINMGDIYKNKCLCLIPFRFAIEMVNRGWILRNVIIWHKPNCMPSSVKDRFTVDFEYLFFFSKNKKYYFKTQREPHTSTRWGGTNDSKCKDGDYAMKTKNGIRSHKHNYHPQGRSKRTVWRITTEPFKGAHFAIFPPKLIETPIKAGCPKSGVVLDPFIGSGTTGKVAIKLKRHFLGFEIKSEYVEMANRGLENVQVSML